MSRSIVLGIISLYGKVRYTLEHYEHLVALMQEREVGQEDTGKEASVLPCPSTMRKAIFPRLLKHLFVQSTIERFELKKNYTHYVPTSSPLSSRQSEAVVVLPSSWARMDVRCLHVLREITCIEGCRCKRRFGASDLRVDSAKHVTERKKFSSHPRTLWVSKNGVPTPSSPGTTIRLHTFDDAVVSGMCAKVNNFSCKPVRYRGELCTSFQSEIISTIHVRFSSECGVYLEEEEASKSAQPDDIPASTHASCLQYLATLCQSGHQSTAEESQLNQRQSDEQPQTRRQRHRVNRRSDTRVNTKVPYLVPSDHVTLVRLGDSRTLGVFVSRFWVQRLDDERNFFLFINIDNSEVASSSCIGTIGAPVFVKERCTSTTTSECQEEMCRTMGTLANGTPFYMYRLILYADDFNPRSTLFPKGSVGGLYMNPCGFHVRSRRSQTTIRTLSLTPAGVSTNSVIEFLIEDLVHGCIEGFDCVDALGQKVKVYLDIMGFIGDYPASSSVVDLKGHNATAPCTSCGFTFNKSDDSSTYAYSTSIHSCHTSYRRTQQRTESIRAAGLSADDGKHLGMSDLDYTHFLDSGSCPLLNFASKHNEKLRNISTNGDSNLSVQMYEKDGYDMNLIAPDHLITGLFKGVLLIVFMQLKSKHDRDRVQLYLRASLSEHGFQSQSLLYKENKKKLVPGLSMSILYCILTTLPTTLEALALLEDLPSKKMLLNLHRFFCLAFWYPSAIHDGEQAWRFVHGSLINSYHRALQILASNFIKSVDKFGKEYPSLASHVDRPNIHRLLELVYHTIPRFHHLAYFCELVFESSHQPLKFFLSRNHTLNSHVYSVHLILAKDWMQRIWALWSMHNDEAESDRFRLNAVLGLIKLFAGDGADIINWSSMATASHFDEFREHLRAVMKGTIEKRLSKWYSDVRMSYNTEPRWELHAPSKSNAFTEQQTLFFRQVLHELSKLCLQREDLFQLCHKALLQRGFGSSARSIHEQLKIGDIVQVLLADGFQRKKFLSNSISGSGSPTFFVVGVFIRSKSESKWAVVKHCKLLYPTVLGQLPHTLNHHRIEVLTPDFYKPATVDQCQYIELSNDIRKVGVVHKCGATGACTFNSDTRRVTHSRTTLEGSRFFILTRSMAYPPRRS